MWCFNNHCLVEIKRILFMCGEHGVAEMSLRETPAKLWVAREKNGYFHTTQRMGTPHYGTGYVDEYPLLAFYDPLVGGFGIPLHPGEI